ncbi:MAG: PH domain-containing protein [Clostridia bacterium]
MNRKSFSGNSRVVWFDRKRYFGMPLSFTRYILVEKQGSYFKLFTSTGLLSTMDNELDLFRIVDITVHRSLFDKIFGVGTIELYCQDASSETLFIEKVKNPYRVREILVEAVASERKKRGVLYSEFFNH